MKTLKVRDEVYENLKSFIIDPFEDNADTVLQRLMDIAEKAKSQCHGFDMPDFTCEPETSPASTVSETNQDSIPKGTRIPQQYNEDATVPL